MQRFTPFDSFPAIQYLQQLGNCSVLGRVSAHYFRFASLDCPLAGHQHGYKQNYSNLRCCVRKQEHSLGNLTS